MLTFTIILSRAVKWDCVLQNLILGQFKSMFVCFLFFVFTESTLWAQRFFTMGTFDGYVFLFGFLKKETGYIKE